MENIEYARSLYQISEILKYLSPSLKGRIPKKFTSYFEANKAENYNWQIDESLPFEKQDLLPCTKEILTVLYKEYLCDDIERRKIEETLNENERKYQMEIREKYNPNDIFKNVHKKLKVNQQENPLIPKCKESFFRKVISKIKLFFTNK